MEIIDFYASDNKDHWLSEINKSDWRAGKYLYELLRDQKLKELCGEWAKVLLLIDGDKLFSFCTYAEQDDVREPSLTPWVGFVYTFRSIEENDVLGNCWNMLICLQKMPDISISTSLRESYIVRSWQNDKTAVCI